MGRPVQARKHAVFSGRRYQRKRKGKTNFAAIQKDECRPSLEELQGPRCEVTTIKGIIKGNILPAAGTNTR